MSQEELDRESRRIIKELTKPKASQHLGARLIALSKRGIHRFAYENPEIAQDARTEEVIQRVIEYVGIALEIIMDYEICYIDGVDYENRIVTAHRESGPIPAERDNSNRANTDSPGNSSNNVVDSPNRPTSAGRIDNPSRGDNRRSSGVFKPPRKSEQSNSAERRKPDGKSKSRDKPKKYTDDQP